MYTDLYETYPEMTMSYAEKYFAHVDTPALSVLPRRSFLEWIRQDRDKKPRDNMVLHAVIAVGSVFASGDAASAHRSEFANICSSATEDFHGSTLHLLLTRLILASLQHLQEDYDKASELYISVYRTGQVEFLGSPAHQDIATPQSAFGLDKGAMIECAKRATWLAGVMSSLGSSRSPYVEKWSMRKFQYSHRSNVQSVMLDSNTSSWPDLSRMATALREVAAMAGTPLALWQHDTEITMNTIKNRLDAWNDVFRGNCARGQATGYRGLADQQVGILYLFAKVLLHRRAYPPRSGREALAHYAHEAFVNARQILDVAEQLSNSKTGNAPEFTMLSPFIGLAIFEAFDIVTARGTMYHLHGDDSSVMSMMSAGLETLETLSQSWYSAREQRDLALDRMKTLVRTANTKQSGNGGFYFSKSMQVSSEWEQDVMYSCPLPEYFSEMNWSTLIQSDGDFCCLDGDDQMNVSLGWRI